MFIQFLPVLTYHLLTVELLFTVVDQQTTYQLKVRLLTDVTIMATFSVKTQPGLVAGMDCGVGQLQPVNVCGYYILYMYIIIYTHAVISF